MSMNGLSENETAQIHKFEGEGSRTLLRSVSEKTPASGRGDPAEDC